MSDHVLTLHHWLSTRGITGDRYTLLHEGRAVITRGTELEARRYAREMHWTVQREDDLSPPPASR